MTLNFYIDKPTHHKKSAIYLYFRMKGKPPTRMKFNTLQYIHPKHWDAKPKDGNHIKKSYKGSDEFNWWLDWLKQDVHAIYNTISVANPEGVPVEELRAAIKELILKRESEKKNNNTPF